MNIQQWQEKFLNLIYSDKASNIFPPSLIRMVANASDEDAEEFKKFVIDYFRQYESLTISSAPLSEMRKLIISISDVIDEEE